MSAAISVNFSCLESAIKNADLASKRAKKYADSLNSGVNSRLSGITGGCNGHVADAYDSVNTKRRELNSISVKFSSFSKKLKNFEQNVKTADATLKSKIDGYSKAYATQHNIKTSPIETAWNWLSGGASSLLNETEFGQWINNSIRKIGDWFGDRWADLKEWYALDGGQFWVNIGLGLLAIVAAVFVIATAGVGLLAIVAIVGAAIAIANSAVQIGANVVALIHKDEDPAWTHRCGKISKASEWFSSAFPDNKVLNFIGRTIDVIDDVCTIITFADFSTKAFTKISKKETLFQKYLGKSGVLDSYFAVDCNSEAKKVLHKFDPIAGRWGIVNNDNEIIRYLTKDESAALKFGEAGSGFKFSLKTGYNNLFNGQYELKGYKILKGEVGADIRYNILSAKSTVSSIGSHISSLKTKGVVSTLRDIHLSNLEKHYEDIPKLKDVSSLKEKLNVLKIRGSIVWDKTTEAFNYTAKTIKSDFGFDSFAKDFKLAKSVNLTKKTWGKIVLIGKEMNDAKKVISNIGNAKNGDFGKIHKPIKEINKFRGAVGDIFS
jgi:uncharacterized protein YukE